VEGWTLLNPLPSTLSRARRSTGEVVMLKVVDKDEFAIHTFLNSLKATQNHTIPILDIIPLEVEKVIVLPQERVLSNILDSDLETTGNSLASQLLEGVRFLHEQNVAHLDLKPDNIVITETMQLKIIDFSVSVRVSELVSWIVGYRGTEGWVAPELKNNPDAKFQPIRADLWATGRVLLYLSKRVGGKFGFAALMRQLLSHNPEQRPYLSKVFQGAPMVKPKGKPNGKPKGKPKGNPKGKQAVGVVKKERPRRKCVAPRPKDSMAAWLRK